MTHESRRYRSALGSPKDGFELAMRNGDDHRAEILRWGETEACDKKGRPMTRWREAGVMHENG